MKIKYDIGKRQIAMTLMPSGQEELTGIGQQGKEIQLVNDNFRFIFPVDIKTTPHPDLLALSAFSAIQPFIHKEVEFGEAVSVRFAEAVREAFGVSVVNVDKKLEPRKRGARHSLAFSSGADSVAAMALMPDDTVKFTYVRLDHPQVEPRRDNFRQTTIESASKFDEVLLVDSDLEYICGPFLQWATWVAVSIPGFLMADQLALSGIAYGHISGADALVRNDKQKPFMHHTWRILYEAAGLDMVLPVVGLSEVGTMTVVKKSGLLAKATSCQLGEYRNPCRECKKCFRKDLILTSIGEMKWNDFLGHLPKYLKSPKVINQTLIQGQPQHMQHIYMYTLKPHYRIKEKPLRLFREKILMSKDHRNLNWVGRHNDVELERNMSDTALLSHVKKKVNRMVKPMTRRDYHVLDRWDLVGYYIQSEPARRVHLYNKQITEALEEYNK